MVSKIQEACGASMRTGFDWAQIEPDPPISGVHTYHWDNFDRIVNSTTSKNIDIIALIVTTPLWASDNSDPDNVHLYPPNNAHRADYIAFLTALVNRYQGKVKYYEFWNEANGCGWHPGCGGDKQAKAQEYLPWQKVTYDTIKNIDSSLSVSTTGMDGADADFLTRLYNLSSTVTCAGHFCWDAVNTHPYNPNGPINFNGLDALHSLMHTNNDNSPVWITEYGWNMSDDTTKASYLRQTLERLNTPNYSYIPIATYLVIADTPQTGEYGLLRDNLTPKSSSFNTFKSLACGE
ncbi:hypothetical protein A2Y99_02050 [Candidatus Gottesmanbacteria bacterium RBG_13_37_7]|uniref:Uncharacterized protein n=1 Tax=Candidatus Gottesmanbacteria bacterium RBG_13_37_7 TaxID=1798369 RepID=A0A1F5YHS1_9BACT|nr:MAG: hypothetical protein A2Y99_02050 [Candidatus Gottesmanbacteria bacterium RBG_13_37_7]